ncbi:magnesium-translocating P-type ATPase [Inquilinus limosus]|uniref:magnesium-translocating P-type ATPase n=1 Tax=Inquilinus limosus TaxID=171674 RepID=UPI000424C341|nr:magnesium-translocating P-type ATPase [Inquilinus limosus]
MHTLEGAEGWSGPIEGSLERAGAASNGLSSAQVSAARRRWGRNDVLAHRRASVAGLLLDRLRNPLILLLLLASGLSVAVGETQSFVIVLAILSISMAIDFVQELQAHRTVEALQRSVAPRVRVRRDGVDRDMPVDELVPGDVVSFSAADIVPADCRLIESRHLFVNQALLTGESYPVEKNTGDRTLTGQGPAGAADEVAMGSSIVSGSATALVLRTGRAAMLGTVAASLGRRRPPDAFEIGVRRFGFLMLRLTLFLVVFVLAVNLAFHRPWLEALMFALALAVGLTPELLPMIVTVTLARGARRMATRRVIVKRLAAIHDLGAMDVLCADKTGTLTEARIRLVAHIDPKGAESQEVLRLACLASVFESGLRSPLDDAILEHGGLDASAWRKIDEVPFDFERRRVSVLVEPAAGGDRLLVVKGAPEDILRISTTVAAGAGETRPLDTAGRGRLEAMFEQIGADGLRGLAIGFRTVASCHGRAALDDEVGLTFAGFVTFVDPPKADAAAAIRALGEAGVSVRILTGDNERVTQHVCAELGIQVTGVLTGDEITRMSDEALLGRLKTVNLFCRVTPQQKRRVLAAFRRLGHVTGFLGDGANDASALHEADVGISVETATDVAKEAADLVLLDHDLSVVHAGVLEGRRTVANVTKYILMGSSSNLGNMMSMAGAALLLPFLPMRPVQVLLNNLLYDLSELGLPFDRVDEDALRRPVRWDLNRITRFMLVLGPISSLFDVLTFAALLALLGGDEAAFQTGWFVESLLTQVLVIFVIRTRSAPWASRPHPLLAALSLGVAGLAILLPFTGPGALLGMTPLPPAFYLFLIMAVPTYLAIVEVAKRRLSREAAG